MDPLTQGVLGAIAAQTRGNRSQLAKAAVIGALSGMAPDLDVLIQSSTDSLLSLEYHRQFTHSLAFIPFGSLICSVIFYAVWARRWQLKFSEIYLWSILGFATHGLLDACTSYGTQLFWPFTDQRISWDIISIIDPLFTLPLLGLVICACRRKQRHWVLVAASWCFTYLAIGFVQHERAIDAGLLLAAERHHQPIRLEAKPSFANLLVWKVIYETDDKFYVAAIKPCIKQTQVWQGDNVYKLALARDLPWLDHGTQPAKDIQRFDWFSAGYLSLDRKDPTRVVDMRYSLLPQEVNPLWGIQLSKTAREGDYAHFYTERDTSKTSPSFDRIWQMILQ